MVVNDAAPRAHRLAVFLLRTPADHHCPWLGNCVGYGNYAYFFKMLAFFWLGCVYVVLVSLPPFLTTLGPQVRVTTLQPEPATAGVVSLETAADAAAAGTRPNPLASTGGFGVDTRITLCFVVCFSVGIAVAILFSWHVYLLLTNQTSIEYLTNQSLKYKLR